MTPERFRDEIARLLYLTAFDNTASATKAWDGDGTKDNPGHAKRQDAAFRQFCRKADAVIPRISSIARDEALEEVVKTIDGYFSYEGSPRDKEFNSGRFRAACDLSDMIRALRTKPEERK